MDQLLSLVVRSNASPNSWMWWGIVGAFFRELVTSVHGCVAFVGGSLVPVGWMCRFSTACATVVVSIGVIWVGLR